jgi:tryptophanyl-tRNA synthetase
MTSRSSQRKRVLSGMRSTGKLHLRNYVGALDNWVRMQDQYDCFFFVADWHALTTDYADTSKIKENSLEVLLDWLAAGLDPERCTMFIQSHVPQHAELHLLFYDHAPRLAGARPHLQRAARKHCRRIWAPTVSGYPVLQAADILIYKGDFVPVGEDQVPHVELTREIARRFNMFYTRKGSYVFLSRNHCLLRPRNFQGPTAGKCRSRMATPSCLPIPSRSFGRSSRRW